MKRLLLLFALVFSSAVFSQAISVNTTTYTIPDLVNSVLINSPCANATNVTWRTGTNFGSSNGIGYFQNTNSAFPIPAGVILSTGNVANAPGPNTTHLNDGNAAWTGDADLEATLAASGISMTSANATVLEFDFTPISPNFSFDFLFASEEYGNYQCRFSDAFAFLLTNTATGETKNLAVVPGTNEPISVVTIRDYLYNSLCPSVNAQYFGSYNGGLSADASATNFNGQTTMLNASAVLTPNVLYHIKLVIADRNDNESDSAIFIASDSFNIGQDVLGADRTVATNTAICFGQDYTIQSGLDPAVYTNISWKRNGAAIAGNDPFLQISQAGNYQITYQAPGCLPISDTVRIQYYNEINTGTATTLYKCDTGAATYTYDLSLNTPRIKQGMNAATTLSYHISENDAKDARDPLPLTYTSAPNQTIFVRVNSHNTPCYTIKQFLLQTAPAPVVNALQPLVQCAGNATATTAVFPLSSQTTTVLGSQSAQTNVVTYHTSEANAIAGTSPLGANYTGANNAVIYVRIQNATDRNCFSTGSFVLQVKPKPLVDVLATVIQCTPFVLQPLVNGNYFTQSNGRGTQMFPGDTISASQNLYIFNQPDGVTGCSAQTIFKIIILKPEEFGPNSSSNCGNYTLPSLIVGNYYTGPGGTGTRIPAGTTITGSQTIYAYFASTTEPSCIIDKPFAVSISPAIEIGTFENVFDCASYTLPPLTSGKYYPQPGGQGGEIAAGTAIIATQTIYVYANTGAPAFCSTEANFTVYIGMDTPSEINQCGSFTLPVLPVGNYYTQRAGTGDLIPQGTVLEQSAVVYIYVAGQSCTDDIHYAINIAQPLIDHLDDENFCDSYQLLPLTNGEYWTQSGGTGLQLHAGDLITSTETIYVFKRSTSTCFNEDPFTLTLNPKPNVPSRAPVTSCNEDYRLTPLTVGNYYTQSGGLGTMLAAGSLVTQTQRLYIYAVNALGCTNESTFLVTVNRVTVDDPADETHCDTYTLPALTAGNYYTLSGGSRTSGNVMKHAGNRITTTTTLYVYAESGDRADNCPNENSFLITINKTPVVAPIADKFACNEYILPVLARGNYYTGSEKSGRLLNAGDAITSNQDVYVYEETATSPNCWDEEKFHVTVFNVDEVDDVVICESYRLPTLAIGKYYSQPNGLGTRYLPGQSINATQTIYVYALSPFTPTCSDQSEFVVTIVDTPVANNVPNGLTTVCDEDATNDGVTTFNLSQLNATVLGSQTGTEFTVTYFANINDAGANVNPITSTTLSRVVARVTNTRTANCFALRTINIQVNKIPEPTPVDGIICYNSTEQHVLRPYTIHSGLGSGYTFEWFNAAGDVVGRASSYTAVTPGEYSIIATSIATGCPSKETFVSVLPSEPAIVTYTITDDFVDSQVVTVHAVGVGGDYEYQLDYGPFQDSNVFENVPSGIHNITVRDKNGCGPDPTVKALVVNYPKYFTPNGDGFHDTWNIIDLQSQTNAKINIYDRYGKFMSQIRPSGTGWDGTSNGQVMPSTDYWFVVNYEEDGIQKEFKAHFAMKR